MVNKPNIPNIIASRYASPEMVEIWSESGKIVLEREFWIAVMKAQRELGLDIPEQAIQAYERVKIDVNPDRIHRREQKLRHDVKARIEEFCELAGYEHIHKGLTSRDLTDNIEQLQILRSIEFIQMKYAACLYALSQKVGLFQAQLLSGRTHNVPAQLTTFGKRLAMFGQDMLTAFNRFRCTVTGYPLRGLKGAVGTQLDQLTLFDGDAEKVAELEKKLAEFLGFKQLLNYVGQVYPRSLDFEVLSGLYQLGSGMSSFAKTLRIMAGFELATEGFKKGQVGSSSMPHKMNSRSCERLNGLYIVLNGFVNMVMGLAGDQWNEGDVSCSVIRRVALPNAMFTIDAMMETFLHIVDEMEIFPAVMNAEVERYLPFLATTTILMEAVKHGAGREAAHEAIKEHAVAVVRSMREKGATENDLLTHLANDSRIPLNMDQMLALLKDKKQFIGEAAVQAQQFVQEVEGMISEFPEARNLTPAAML